jgi:hypothetical protein
MHWLKYTTGCPYVGIIYGTRARGERMSKVVHRCHCSPVIIFETELLIELVKVEQRRMRPCCRSVTRSLAHECHFQVYCYCTPVRRATLSFLHLLHHSKWTSRAIYRFNVLLTVVFPMRENLSRPLPPDVRAHPRARRLRDLGTLSTARSVIIIIQRRYHLPTRCPVHAYRFTTFRAESRRSDRQWQNLGSRWTDTTFKI